MIHFVGAGPGSPDLITVRGKQYLEEADVIIYAGSGKSAASGIQQRCLHNS